MLIEQKEIDGKIYQVCDSTFYHADTKKEVIQWLETSRSRKQRIRIFYGEKGKCWNEEHNILGHIGRSMGTIKIPLLIYNSRSRGGTGILDNCIVQIDTKNSRGEICTVYLDNTIKFDHFISTDLGNVYNETKDILYARCKDSIMGQKLADFMNGKRWSK